MDARGPAALKLTANRGGLLDCLRGDVLGASSRVAAAVAFEPAQIVKQNAEHRYMYDTAVKLSDPRPQSGQRVGQRRVPKTLANAWV